MTLGMPRNGTTYAARSGAAALTARVARILTQGPLARHRAALVSYGQVLAGNAGRLGLQIVYFFVLANTLSLHEMGIFASISATGVLIGCLAGLGFQSFVFRAAAARRSSLGAYLAIFYVCLAAALPVCLLISLPMYFYLFDEAVQLDGYLAIILAEVVLLRLLELLIQVNNGLGRYGAAASVSAVSSAVRAGAAVAFMLAGGGETETWAVYYVGGNALAVLGLMIIYHPRVRLVWRPRLMLGRLRQALLFAFAYFAFLAQGEVDKVLVLWLAGDRMAGIYAIAMRIVDLTAVPLRPMFLLYSRKLIQNVRVGLPCAATLRIEALVAFTSTAGFLVVVALVSVWPGLLGANVATAAEFLGVLVLVPAVKNLFEFHAELFFAYGRLAARAVVAGAVVVLKAAGLALLLTLVARPQEWGLWLNALYGGLYVLSFCATYGLLRNKAVR